MQVEKKYHFYAAHRNEYLEGKCHNLHGHTYYVVVTFEFLTINDNGVTMLFETIDNILTPLINKLDHCTLIHQEDKSLLNALVPLKMKIQVFPFPTSAENLAKYLFNEIYNLIPALSNISLQETTSSIVRYP